MRIRKSFQHFSRFCKILIAKWIKKYSFTSAVSFVIILIIIILVRNNSEKQTSIRDYPEIKESGELNIVMEYNSIDYYIDKDTIKGIQYNLAKKIEQYSGLKVNIFLENNLVKSIQDLEKNQYDIIARNIPITNEIKEHLSFANPIAKSKQILVQRKNNENDSVIFISNQLELANKIIHVPENSPAILRIKNLSDEIAEPIYIQEDKQYTGEQLIYKVAYNEIDYVVVDNDIALINKDLFPNLDINTDITFTQLQAWAVRKESPILRDSLNVWLGEWKMEN